MYAIYVVTRVTLTWKSVKIGLVVVAAKIYNTS